MALHIKDLPKDMQRKVQRQARIRMTQDEIKKHALAVAALLLDDRDLTARDARKVLQKALALLR